MLKKRRQPVNVYCGVLVFRCRDNGKEEIKMHLDVWSIISIIVVVVGFFGGIWYEHK